MIAIIAIVGSNSYFFAFFRRRFRVDVDVDFFFFFSRARFFDDNMLICDISPVRRREERFFCRAQRVK